MMMPPFGRRLGAYACTRRTCSSRRRSAGQRASARRFLALKHAEAQVTGVDTVTGPYDVIVQMEADDLDKLGNAITDGIQRIEGVARTTTCLAVRLS